MRGPIHINRQWLERRITNRLVSLRRIVMAGMLVAGTNAFAAPTVPPYFSAAAVAPRQVNLSWLQSTDPNSAVTSYRIYRNGALLASAPQELYDPRYPDTAQHAFQDQTVAASTTYTYYIVAQNSLNQLSPNSATITVTTPAGSGGLLLPERQIDWSANRAVGVPGGIPTNRSRIIE